MGYALCSHDITRRVSAKHDYPSVRCTRAGNRNLLDEGHGIEIGEEECAGCPPSAAVAGTSTFATDLFMLRLSAGLSRGHFGSVFGGWSLVFNSMENLRCRGCA
jgi:hypothetical protein